MDADADGSGGGATVTVGPTSGGMVRILVVEAGREISMDFEPDEAQEIADELRAAADRARAAGAHDAPPPSPTARPGGGKRR